MLELERQQKLRPSTPRAEQTAAYNCFTFIAHCPSMPFGPLSGCGRSQEDGIGPQMSAETNTPASNFMSAVAPIARASKTLRYPVE
jgi:hypothetical protein